jgi:hypothetical protein
MFLGRIWRSIKAEIRAFEMEFGIEVATVGSKV